MNSTWVAVCCSEAVSTISSVREFFPTQIGTIVTVEWSEYIERRGLLFDLVDGVVVDVFDVVETSKRSGCETVLLD